jgi:predicted nucleic acid-binding protein
MAIAARIAAAAQVYVSSIVLGELYFGAYGSPTRQDAALADVETVERTITTLTPDAATARIYGRIKDALSARASRCPITTSGSPRLRFSTISP